MTKSLGTVRSVETWKCVVALPEPFELGHLTVSERDYVFVRLTTDTGISGVSFGLGRGAPIDMVVTEVLASAVLGRDISELSDLVSVLAQRRPQHAPEGLVLRALSQVDVALWDIRAQIAGKPLWELLGGHGQTAADILLVEGYHMAGETDDEFARRIAAKAEQGFAGIKIEASSPDHDAISRRLEASVTAVGGRAELMIDLAYAFEPSEGETIGWFDLDLAWAEDPAHGNLSTRLERVRQMMPTPLAVGDEVTNLQVLRRLIEDRAVDIIRLDVTCHGGFTQVSELSALAAQNGVRISTHVYPELHQHLVFGLSEAGPVEMFPDNGLWDATATLMRTPSPERDGERMVLRRPSSAGLGLEVDWDAVARHSVRHQLTR